MHDMKHTNSTMRLAGILGGTAVIVLALAAHSLEKFLPEKSLHAIITAGEIQLFHAVALLALASFIEADVKKIKIISAFMTTGVLLFSCSIYILAFREILGLPWLKIAGPVTPVGGVLLIISWLLIALLGSQKDKASIK